MHTHPWQIMWFRCPSVGVEALPGDLGRCQCSQFAQAKHRNLGVASRTWVTVGPFTACLRRFEMWNVARMSQDREQHETGHHPPHLGIGQARDRYVRQIVTRDQSVDAGPEVDHQLKIRKTFEKALGRHPYKGEAHCVRVSDGI